MKDVTNFVPTPPGLVPLARPGAFPKARVSFIHF
jgi:hypothetical protein